jgi:hypothetical protein
MDASSAVQSMYAEGSQKYTDETEKQITLLAEKRRAVSGDIASIESKIANNNKLSASERLTSDQIVALTDDLKDRKKTLLDVQKAEYDYAVQLAQNVIDIQNKIDQTVIDSYQSQIDALQAQWDAEATAEERSKRQLEISDLQSKIDIFRSGTLTTISDELAKQLGLEEEKAAAIQLQNDIIKQQQILQNVQNEKNVRLFQNGQFEWVADPRKIKEEQDKLTDLQEQFDESKTGTLEDLLSELKDKQEDYSKWEIEESRKRTIANLQALMKAKEDEIALRNEKFEEEKTAWAQNGIDLNTILTGSLETLKGTYGTKWDEILGVLTNKLTAAKQMYAEMMSMAGTSTPTGNNNNSSPTTSPTSSAPEKSSQLRYLENLSANGNDGQKKWADNEIKLGRYHTGLREGTVGDGKSISSILASKFGLKNNEKMVALLNGEAVIKNPVNMIENIVGGFKGMANMLTGLTPKTAAASSAGNVVNNHYNIDKVVANNPDDFVKEMRLRSKFKY